MAKYPEHIVDYSFVSVRHDNIMGFENRAKVSATPGFPRYNSYIQGVEENYLNCIMTDLYLPTESGENTKMTNGKVDGISDLFLSSASVS